MNVGLVLTLDGNEVAVTKSSVLVAPAVLPSETWWLSGNPSGNNGNIASWSGLMAEAFNLGQTVDILDAKNKIESIDRVIPDDCRKSGSNLKSVLNDFLPLPLQIMEPFVSDIACNQLDKVLVQSTRGYVNQIDIVDTLSLSELMLPKEIVKLKHLKSGATGNRAGLYHCGLNDFDGILASLNGQKKWLSNVQIAKLRHKGHVAINECILISNNEYVPLKEHDIYKPFLGMVSRLSTKKDKADFQAILLRHLINLKHRNGRHPFSMFLQTTAWVSAFSMAESLSEMGIKVLSFDYNSVQTELIE